MYAKFINAKNAKTRYYTGNCPMVTQQECDLKYLRTKLLLTTYGIACHLKRKVFFALKQQKYIFSSTALTAALIEFRRLFPERVKSWQERIVSSPATNGKQAICRLLFVHRSCSQLTYGIAFWPTQTPSTFHQPPSLPSSRHSRFYTNDSYSMRACMVFVGLSKNSIRAWPTNSTHPQPADQ